MDHFEQIKLNVVSLVMAVNRGWRTDVDRISKDIFTNIDVINDSYQRAENKLYECRKKISELNARNIHLEATFERLKKNLEDSSD